MANKKITELQLRDNVTSDLSIPSDDGIQSYRVTAQQIKDFILANGNVITDMIADLAVTTGKLANNSVTAAKLSAVTGSGNVVLATSPTLVTPNLGTPSAVVLTNATGLPLTSGVTGALPPANGGTGYDGGAWTIYVPTVTWSGGSGLTAQDVSGAYLIIGKLLFFRVSIRYTYSTTPSGMTFTLPASKTATVSQIVAGRNWTQGWMLQGVATAGSNTVNALRYENSTIVGASNETYTFNGMIEIN